MSLIDVAKYADSLSKFDTLERAGRVTKIVGLAVEATGPPAKIGDVCEMYTLDNDRSLRAEIIGFREGQTLLMPFGSLEGIGLGSYVVYTGTQLRVPVGMSLVGKVLDALGNPFDGSEHDKIEAWYPADNMPPNPLERERIKEALPLGIKAIDSMLTVGKGQRLGIFAGTGVGKSTIMGMMSRYAVADINVIVLVGERGREVRDFIEKDLGEEGLKKSVLVIATSDQPALLRLKCAMTGTAVAEYFRDQGLKVLMLMDSLTRFAMAQREIGMAAGEPPVSRGFPPSVFAILPKLLERTGMSDKGSITALYTVLVEGDDMNEPISDTVRGILDGHIILSRAIAQRNHYPPIDILGSVSRVMPEIVTKEHFEDFGKIKSLIAIYKEAEDLINIGAYKQGANPEIDKSVELHYPIESFLKQGMTDSYTYDETLEMMRQIASS
ncbi:MAG: flagellar protein export ATPase FliI [Oscillospiraceae bacterium]|nr:flagellar protein export ATPase FliI [Oscillospiraceae bacterium]MCL2278242.1 flagellar protein export ATPase FliI [Oscillospiraceae bacterium]